MTPPGDDDMPWIRYRLIDPRRHVERYASKIGRRGAALTIIGIVWAGIGVGSLIAPPDAVAPPEDAAVIVGTAWIVSGVVAIMTAPNRQGRDALGFMALFAMAAYSLLVELVDVVLWIVPDGSAGDLRGIVGVLQWLAIISLVVLLSGWRESEK